MGWLKWLAIGIATAGIAYGAMKLDFSRTDNGWKVYNKSNPTYSMNYDTGKKEINYEYRSRSSANNNKSINLKYNINDSTIDAVVKNNNGRYGHLAHDIRNKDTVVSGFYKNRYYNALFGIENNTPCLHRFYTRRT